MNSLPLQNINKLQMRLKKILETLKQARNDLIF